MPAKGFAGLEVEPRARIQDAGLLQDVQIPPERPLRDGQPLPLPELLLEVREARGRAEVVHEIGPDLVEDGPVADLEAPADVLVEDLLHDAFDVGLAGLRIVELERLRQSAAPDVLREGGVPVRSNSTWRPVSLVASSPPSR